MLFVPQQQVRLNSPDTVEIKQHSTHEKQRHKQNIVIEQKFSDIIAATTQLMKQQSHTAKKLKSPSRNTPQTAWKKLEESNLDRRLAKAATAATTTPISQEDLSYT